MASDVPELVGVFTYLLDDQGGQIETGAYYFAYAQVVVMSDAEFGAAIRAQLPALARPGVAGA